MVPLLTKNLSGRFTTACESHIIVLFPTPSVSDASPTTLPLTHTPRHAGRLAVSQTCQASFKLLPPLSGLLLRLMSAWLPSHSIFIRYGTYLLILSAAYCLSLSPIPCQTHFPLEYKLHLRMDLYFSVLFFNASQEAKIISGTW